MPVISQAKDRFWVTFDKEDANSQLANERVYHCYFPTNRNIPNLIRNTRLARKILSEEKPDLIISSGAAVAIPFFWLGHKRGIKCVYVEVFDRIDKPTISGKICRRYADAFVVQWPEQLEVYPGSVNLGSIF